MGSCLLDRGTGRHPDGRLRSGGAGYGAEPAASRQFDPGNRQLQLPIDPSGRPTCDPSRSTGDCRRRGQATSAALDPSGSRLAVIHGCDLSMVLLEDPAQGVRLVGRSGQVLERVAFHPGGDRLATVDASGRAEMWSVGDAPAAPIRQWRGWRESAFWDLQFDPTGSLLFATDESGNTVVWGMDDPPDADPYHWITAMSRQVLAIHPSGRWFAETATNGFGVWPFDRSRYAWVLRGHTGTVEELRFGQDGSWLVSAALDGTVRLWALNAAAHQRSRVLGVIERPVSEHVRLDVAPDGTFVAVTTTAGSVQILPLDGSPTTELRGLEAAAHGAGYKLGQPPGRSGWRRSTCTKRSGDSNMGPHVRRRTRGRSRPARASLGPAVHRRWCASGVRRRWRAAQVRPNRGHSRGDRGDGVKV